MNRNKKSADFMGEGYSLESEGFVKTEGFEKIVSLMATAGNELCKLMEDKKSFRMELYYDAKTLNTEYRFYVPNARNVPEDSESQSDLCQNLHL